MSEQKFCHLHIHTDMSVMDGAMKMENLLEQAKKHGMKKIALTNHGNMINMPKWMAMAEKEGIQLIPGCELYVCWDFPRQMKDSDHKTIYHMVALAKNQTGWHNLLQLVTEAFISGKYYKPRVDKELLEKYNEGIVFTTACLNGIFNAKLNRQNLPLESIKEEGTKLRNILGEDVYFEIQRHPDTPDQDKGNEMLMQFSKDLNIPLVATCDSHYATPQDFDAWRSLMTLQMNGYEHRAPNDFYVKSQEEMLNLFQDIPEATANSMKIADMCEPIEIDSSYKFPVFDTQGMELSEYLKKECEDGLMERFNEKNITGVAREPYKARLKEELDIINGMGFPGYMLIVGDFVRAAKDRGIYVGPGRGSAAGSLVAWVQKTTNVDPLKYGLLMERFLNPERVSMPDIDVDFMHTRRDEMKEYMAEKYGADKVASIMTIGTMAARGALRDIGRVFKLPPAECDGLAKQVPDGKRGRNVYLKTITDPEHEDYSKEFMQYINEKPIYKEVLRVAKTVEGMCRSTGTHAAGVVVSDDKPLVHHTALMLDKNDKIVTQNDMKVLEKNLGLIKFDFLGLSTETVIHDAVEMIKENHGVEIDIDQINEHDDAVFDLLCQGDLMGVFQLSGSSGFKDVVMQIQPRSIEEIGDITSLYRPGPLDNGFIPKYVEAKRSGNIEYMIKVTKRDIDEKIKELLQPTKGVLIYQEQVMKLAQIMAGYSLGKADLLRRAMGKKIPEEMEAARGEFVDGCKENGLTEEEANTSFDIIAKFAEYGFNKSHAIAYSIITYQTAWLKTHYPKEFLAACLTDEQNDQDKTIAYINNCRENEIEILPPDVNESNIAYRATENGIRFGLGAIKGFGQVGAEYVLKERNKNGEFKSFPDFIGRVNLQKINKAKIQILVKAGCFDKIAA
jgi:DNA polymerase-3 subunit alpha